MPEVQELIDLHVLVTFDAQAETFAWSGDASSDGTITVDALKAWIELELVTTNLKPTQQPATFLDELPVAWPQGQTPAGMRSWVPTQGEKSLVIEDKNLAYYQDESFDFAINILFDGVVVTSPDPTILNKDIGGIVPSVTLVEKVA